MKTEDARKIKKLLGKLDEIDGTMDDIEYLYRNFNCGDSARISFGGPFHTEFIDGVPKDIVFKTIAFIKREIEAERFRIKAEMDAI
jgi:hypothetical protein